MSDEKKTQSNRQSEEAMRLYLRSKSWPEKILSIKRMNAAQKIARSAMRATLKKQAD